MYEITSAVQNSESWTQLAATEFAKSIASAIGLKHPIGREDDEDWIFVDSAEARLACVHIKLSLALVSTSLLNKVPTPDLENLIIVHFTEFETAEFSMKPSVLTEKFGVDGKIWSDPLNPQSFSAGDLVWMTI